MVPSSNSEILTWAALLCFSLLALAITFLFKQKNKKLISDTERKEQILSTKSIESIVDELNQSLAEIQSKITNAQPVVEQLDAALNDNTKQLNYIDCGLLPPAFKSDDRETLKEQISDAFDEQFQTIILNQATTALSNWKWLGSEEKGKQMTDAYRYLLLKAFNAEFDMIRRQMRYSTYDSALKKLYRLKEQLEKLGETARVIISEKYFNQKQEELDIWYSELQHKEDLKQEKKEQQMLLREQAKLSKTTVDTEELEDSIYYRKSDLNKAKKLALQLHGANATNLEAKIAKMQKEIEELESKFERSLSQAQQTRAGYIYVISNIGSFGQGIYKIGMTRRLEPMDRVNELGDASVPFKFDVHAMAFTEDAPKIEKLLHAKFHNKRVNIENQRKEFFRVNLEDIEKVIKELDVECDWYFDAEAKEFNESLLIRESFNQRISEKNISSSAHQLPTSI